MLLQTKRNYDELEKSDHAVPSLETRNAEYQALAVSHDLALMRFRMLKTGAYSDLTIVCGDKEIRVHRYIVCMLSGRIKSRDAANEKVCLHDYASACERLLKTCL